MPGDPFNLERFVAAQAGVYDTALAEIQRGRKTSHWMWFVFPQLEGLGFSAIARRYAIRSLAEARAYLDHPLLGPRLETITQAAIDAPAGSAKAVFGEPDDMKLRSSLTLFAIADPGRDMFQDGLNRYFGGPRDPMTEQLIVEQNSL